MSISVPSEDNGVYTFHRGDDEIYTYRTRNDTEMLFHVMDRDNGDDPIYRWRCGYCGAEFDSDDGYHGESTSDINVFFMACNNSNEANKLLIT